MSFVCVFVVAALCCEIKSIYSIFVLSVHLPVPSWYCVETVLRIEKVFQLLVGPSL